MHRFVNVCARERKVNVRPAAPNRGVTAQPNFPLLDGTSTGTERPVCLPNAPLVMRASRSQEERSAALQLVHQSYCRAGLADQHSSTMRVMRHHLLDSTQIFVAKRSSQIAFTVTLVADDLYGMPSDVLFEDEINRMRRDGLRLAEVSCVASNPEALTASARLDTLVSMIGLTIHAARHHGIDRLLLSVHPRHAKVYRRMFGCVASSEVKEYQAVLGNPAVLCVHDFAELDSRRYSLYDRIYSVRYEDWELEGVPMDDRERDEFERHIGSDIADLFPLAA